MVKSVNAAILTAILIAVAAGGEALAMPSPCRVSLGIPGNKPFTELKDGQIGGVIASTAATALRRMGCRVTGRQLPFARMYKWIHTGRLDVATSVLKTPERAALAYYSLPIVTEYALVGYLRGLKNPPRHISDLTSLRVGAQLGFRYPALDGRGIQLRRERSYEITLRKLGAKQLDAVLIGSITGPFLARDMALGAELDFMPLAVGETPLGVALARQTFSQADVELFDREVRKLTSAESWRETLAAYGILNFVKPWRLLPSTADTPPERQPATSPTAAQ